MLYEIAISGRDEADHHKSLKRAKEGDIIAIRPSPWHWGLMEIKALMIVLVDIDAPFHELAHRLCSPEYGSAWDRTQLEDLSVYEAKDAPDEEAAAVISSGIYEHPCRIVGTSQYMEFPEQTRKRRFYVNSARLAAIFPTMDLAKMRDPSMIYQPFKKRSDLILKFNNEQYKTITRPEDGRAVIVSASTDARVSRAEFVVDAGALDKEEEEVVFTFAKGAHEDLVYDRTAGRKLPPDSVLTSMGAQHGVK